MPLAVPNSDEWFPERGGFPVANWDAVTAWVEANIGDDDQDLDVAWEQAWRHWVERLEKALGPAYGAAESENFFLISRLSDSASDRLLDELEDRLVQADELLGPLANPVDEGQMAVLVIDEPARYRTYVGLFYPSPEQYVLESGVFLEEGFPQFVLPHGRVDDLASTLTRELAHYLLAHHKDMPTWLDEGIAQWVECELAGTVSPDFDEERLAEHRAYWNAATIQDFWDGASFRTPGQGCALSYELALWLTARIVEDSGAATPRVETFITDAQSDDAGEGSARQHLQASLGELLTQFLDGTSGTWKPNPESWLRVRGAARNGHKH